LRISECGRGEGERKNDRDTGPEFRRQEPEVRMKRERAKTFQDLIVWQKAHQFVLSVYRSTEVFPKKEIYGLTSQFRRAAISTPANIAEGFRKKGKPDKEILAELESMKSGDTDWQSGRMFSLIYNAGEEIREITRKAFNVYFMENVLRKGEKENKTLFSTDTLLLPSSEGISAEIRQNPNAIGYDRLTGAVEHTLDELATSAPGTAGCGTITWTTGAPSARPIPPCPTRPPSSRITTTPRW